MAAPPAPAAPKAGGGPTPIHVVSMEAIAEAAKATKPAIPEGRSPYVDFLGVMQHPEVNAGPIFRLPFKHDLIGNPMLPALHGGVLAGFAETAMIMHMVATNPHSEKAIPKAIDFSIDYLRSAKPIDTYAQRHYRAPKGNRVSLVQVNNVARRPDQAGGIHAGPHLDAAIKAAPGPEGRTKARLAKQMAGYLTGKSQKACAR